MGWPPDVFWRSTPHELFAAMDGWRRANDPKAVEAERESRFTTWAAAVMAAVG